MKRTAVLETALRGVPVRRGKVRDIYDLGDRLLLVATDRISAFDWVLPTGIPDKGRVLTQISAFWFELLGEPNHLIATDVAEAGSAGRNRPGPAGRPPMLVRKTEVVPIECVVRGYLAGSGWKEYQKQGTVCGIKLPAGLARVRPAARADLHARHQGRERARREHLVRADGRDRRPGRGRRAARRSLAIYQRGAEHARSRGIIIADTKFEWGWATGRRRELILIDEVLTPDSSRFWPADQYEPGHGQPSFDKQFVRDWLESTDWDKNSPPPALPERHRRQDPREVHRGLRDSHGPRI